VNLGEVPVMVVVSVLVVASWSFSMIANYYWTGGSALLATVFLAANLVVSAVVTRYVTMPLKPLFRAINKQYDKPRGHRRLALPNRDDRGDGGIRAG